MNGETWVSLALAWGTVLLGIYLSYRAIRATFYFARHVAALPQSWFLRGRLRTCRRIATVTLWFTFARIVSLSFGTNIWFSIIGGLLIVWLAWLAPALEREAADYEGGSQRVIDRPIK